MSKRESVTNKRKRAYRVDSIKSVRSIINAINANLFHNIASVIQIGDTQLRFNKIMIWQYV